MQHLSCFSFANCLFTSFMCISTVFRILLLYNNFLFFVYQSFFFFSYCQLLSFLIVSFDEKRFQRKDYSFLFYVYVCVCVCMRSGPEEGFRSPGAGITDTCMPLACTVLDLCCYTDQKCKQKKTFSILLLIMVFQEDTPSSQCVKRSLVL